MLQIIREEAASAIMALGYNVDNSWHFAMRSSDKTASAYINTNGTIFDFGNRFHGDLIDFILENGHAKNFTDAKIEAERLLSQTINLNFSTFAKPAEKKSGFIPKKYIESFIKERQANFKRFSELLAKALPSVDFERRKEIAIQYDIGYSSKADRLIMPIKDEDGQIINLWKYNPNPTPYKDADGKEIKPDKVMFTKGRERIPFNLADLVEYKNSKEWIFLCEGEKDVLNAVANGYKAITFGSASSKCPIKYLPLLKGLKVVVCYDYDKAGHDGMHGYTDARGIYHDGIIKQLESVVAQIHCVNWEDKARKEGFTLFEKFDMTDYLCQKKTNQKPTRRI